MRDLKKESEWRKNKYTRVLADLDKELGDKLKDKLKTEGKSVSDWIRENAEKYIKE